MADEQATDGGIDFDNFDMGGDFDLDSLLSGSSDDLDALLDAQLAEALAKEQGLDGSELFENADFMDMDDSVSDLDEELSKALDKDLEAESSVELEESIEDFVKDVAVYSDDDTVEQVEYETLLDRINEVIEGISPKFLMAMIWSLIAIVAVALALSITFMRDTMRLSTELAERGTIIRQGPATANDAAFIFVEEPISFSEGEITLAKLNLSRISSVFYFNGYINMNNYDVRLYDERGRIYYLDRSYYEGIDLSDSTLDTLMWFDPLPQDVESFFIEITNLETRDSTLHKFSMGQELILERPKYVSASIAAQVGDATLELSNSVFSNTGSQLTYILRGSGEGNELILGHDGQEYISLFESGRRLMRPQHSFRQYKFSDGLTLGRMDFVPVRSFDNNIEVRFDNLYAKHPVNQEISLGEIFYTNAEPTKTLDIGPYKLVIERGGIQVNRYILVMHTQDTREDAFYSRTQSFLDVTMIARRGDRSIELKPSIIRDSPEGTDIVFDGSAEESFLFAIPIEQISFRIDNAYFKLPQTTVPIDISQSDQRLPINPEIALRSVVRAFESRLGYKSGNVGFDELGRFSENVLQNRALMAEYRPTGESDADISVHVTAWHLQDDRLYAVMRESWRGEEYFHRVHKVIADYGDLGWIVTEDEIIN